MEWHSFRMCLPSSSVNVCACAFRIRFMCYISHTLTHFYDTNTRTKFLGLLSIRLHFNGIVGVFSLSLSLLVCVVVIVGLDERSLTHTWMSRLRRCQLCSTFAFASDTHTHAVLSHLVYVSDRVNKIHACDGVLIFMRQPNEGAHTQKKTDSFNSQNSSCTLPIDWYECNNRFGFRSMWIFKFSTFISFVYRCVYVCMCLCQAICEWKPKKQQQPCSHTNMNSSEWVFLFLFHIAFDVYGL